MCIGLGDLKQLASLLFTALVVACIGPRQFNGAYFVTANHKAPVAEARSAARQIASRLGYRIDGDQVGQTYQAVLTPASEEDPAERVVVVVTSNSYDDQYSVVVRKPTPGETERTLEVRRVIETVLKGQGVTWTVEGWERTMAQ